MEDCDPLLATRRQPSFCQQRPQRESPGRRFGRCVDGVDERILIRIAPSGIRLFRIGVYGGAFDVILLKDVQKHALERGRSNVD